MINGKSELLAIGTPEYDKNFWNSLRSKPYSSNELAGGQAVAGSYLLPSFAQGKFTSELRKTSIFRKYCTEHPCTGVPGSIWAYDIEDPVQFIEEGQAIPVKDLKDGLTKLQIGSHKIACINRSTAEFFNDQDFDVENHVIKILAQSFAKTEDKAFILGNGTTEPTGLLHSTKGAALGVTTASSNAVTYDEVLSLYFALKPDYRLNGVWIMNDTTALALRKLKDESGNYLWNSNNNTIFDRPVVYCSNMPNIGAGNKCILFGDLSYYWIVDRDNPSVKPLTEKYAAQGLTAFFAYKFLDARLVRSDAVKYLQVKQAQ